jgi:enoyl-CoA hydratase/carnithine racemase
MPAGNACLGDASCPVIGVTTCRACRTIAGLLFRPPKTRFGLVPGGGRGLARRFGRQYAGWPVLSGRRIGAMPAPAWRRIGDTSPAAS